MCRLAQWLDDLDRGVSPINAHSRIGVSDGGIAFILNGLVEDAPPSSCPLALSDTSMSDGVTLTSLWIMMGPLLTSLMTLWMDQPLVVSLVLPGA